MYTVIHTPPPSTCTHVHTQYLLFSAPVSFSCELSPVWYSTQKNNMHTYYIYVHIKSIPLVTSSSSCSSSFCFCIFLSMFAIWRCKRKTGDTVIMYCTTHLNIWIRSTVWFIIWSLYHNMMCVTNKTAFRETMIFVCVYVLCVGLCYQPPSGRQSGAANGSSLTMWPYGGDQVGSGCPRVGLASQQQGYNYMH